jgi:hypothetical protein
MKTVFRFALAAALLAGASYGQRALLNHLQAAALPAGHQLAPSIATLPKSIGAWHGENERLGAAADDATASFRRNYFHAATGQAATVYATYSPAGEQPSGAAEALAALVGGRFDAAVPREFEIAPGVAVSQVRIVRGATSQWLCRWSYRLPLRHQPQLDFVQTAYRRAHFGPPHLTIDLFVPDNFPTDADAVREFARLVDAAVRPLVGPDAERADVRARFHQLFFN